MQFVFDAVSWIKDNWVDVVLYGSVIAVLFISLALRNTFRKLKQSVVSMFTLDGFIFFVLTSIFFIAFLVKLGILRV